MKWGGNGPQRLGRLCLPVTATILDALRVINDGSEAIGFVCDGSERVLGVITDGDIRRAILDGCPLDACCLSRVMNSDFVSVGPDAGRAEVLDVMRARKIGQVPVLDSRGRLVGMHTIGHIISAHGRPNNAVIFAGGQGSRLRPYTQHMPKPMLRVAGRPILERLVFHLMSHGVTRIYLAVNYLAHVIEDYFKDGTDFGCHISYLREDRPLGTGGALGLLDPIPSEPILVLNGDLLTQCDFGRLLDFHNAGGYSATLAVRPYSVEVPYGVVELDGSQVTGICEKPTYHMQINAAMYVLSPDVLRLVPANAEYSMVDLLKTSSDKGLSIGAHVVEQDWLDIGRSEELRKAHGLD